MKKYLFIILGLCLLLRVAALFTFHAPLANDASAYDNIARNLLAGYGFTDGSLLASKPPVYPLVVATMYLVSGSNDPLTAKIAQVLFSLLLCGLICILGQKFFNEKVGLLAAALFAIDGIFIYFTAQVLSDILFALLVLAGVMVLKRGLDSHNWADFGWAGLFIALATQTKGTSILLPVFLAAALLIAGRKNLGKYLLVFLTVYVLALLPWTVRNYQWFNRVIISSTNGGQNLLEANNPYLKFSELGNWPVYSDLVIMNPEYSAPPKLNEAEWDRFLRGKAVDFIVHNPGRVLILSAAKFIKYWTPWPVYPWPFPVLLMAFLTQGLAVIAGVAGIWLLRKDWRQNILPLGLILYFTLMHLVFFAMIRYRMVIMPYLYIFAAYVLLLLKDKFDRKAVHE